eukprot:g12902.t1
MAQATGIVNVSHNRKPLVGKAGTVVGSAFVAGMKCLDAGFVSVEKLLLSGVTSRLTKPDTRLHHFRNTNQRPCEESEATVDTCQRQSFSTLGTALGCHGLFRCGCKTDVGLGRILWTKKPAL